MRRTPVAGPSYEQLLELRDALAEALTYVQSHLLIKQQETPIEGVPEFDPDAPVLAEVDARRAAMLNRRH